ncbi:uncharacterized protein LOC133667802 isoform X2 [Apis cerana]|uniref:uncharacterized protein LOC133667802 isoform X2 n=1 Tax=Apis cerana TaxID=7461 RepID=UPI002B232921|nr:uncharacterized protein LOC133667802 isoform X2 [Apis cerana]
MKKDRTKLLNASTSYNEFFVKPYGFCCDIKNYDPKLSASRKRSVPLFPSSGLSGGGPDIKIRIQEHDDILNFSPRSTQRNVRDRVGLRGKYLRGVDRQLVDRRLRRGFELQSLADLITSRRLRGPLQWYLEDEIAAAREIMMTKKQEMYNAEMKKNIKIAKQKEKRRRRRKKKISSKKKDKEDINEDETKNTV